MKTYKHIAAMGDTIWSTVYIVSIDSEIVTFQYGYLGSDGPLLTRDIEYGAPDWSDTTDEPYFMYQGSHYWIADFMVLT